MIGPAPGFRLHSLSAAGELTPVAVAPIDPGLSIRSGHLVLIRMHDPLQTAAAAFALWRAGAVPSVVPPDTIGSLKNMARKLRARALWTAEGITEFDDAEPVPNAAYVQLTSGTTAEPRAAVLSESAIRFFLDAYAERMRLSAADTYLNWLPLHHDFGFFQGLALPALLGARAILVTPKSVMRDPASLLRAMSRHGVTATSIFNSGFALIERAADSKLEGVSLESIRLMACGGEPIREFDVARFVKRFGKYGLRKWAIRPGYGMAESVMCCAACTAGPLRVDRIEARSLVDSAIPSRSKTGAAAVACCGPPLKGVRIEIRNERGESLEERSIGEIVVSGRTLMNGYLGDPDATAKVLRDGWLHTGDLGYLLNGQLYVCDRKTDRIVCGGRKISPEVIEAIAMEALGDTARRVIAFGVPNDALGTESAVLICATASMSDDSWEWTAERIRRRVTVALRIGLSDIRRVPHSWIEVTTSGKPARRKAREKHIASGFAKRTGGDSPLDLARRELGMPTLDRETNLVDAGADSLALVRLLIRVETEFQTAINADQWLETPTIASLEALIAGDELIPTGILRRHFDKPIPPWYGRVNAWARQGPLIKGRALPYAQGHTLLRHWISLPAVRKQWLAEEIELIEQAFPDASPEERERSLLAHAWRRWRVRALETPEAFQRWVRIAGREHVDRELERDTGLIIALAHSPLMWLALGLPWSKERPLAVIGNVRLPESQQAPFAFRQSESGAIDMRGRVAQMRRAREVLAQRGVVWIAPDLSLGSGGVVVPFRGRWRVFRPGVAELALDSRAPVLPAFASLAFDGTVTFEFLPPLSEPEGLTREERIDAMLREYAAVLESRWSRGPAEFDVVSMKEFVRAYPAFPFD